MSSGSTIRRRVSLLLWLALAPISALASGQPPSATGSIEGHVLIGQSDEPLPYALVLLRSLGTMAIEQSVMADADGHFRFPGRSAGRYQLRVRAAGYIIDPSAGVSAEPGVIDLRANDIRTDLHLRVVRGAVVTGFVTDDLGDPLVDQQVDIAAVVDGPEERRLTLQNTTFTDDRGLYRFSSLSAGRYVVFASRSPSQVFGSNTDVQPVPTYYPGVLTAAEADAIVVAEGGLAEHVNFAAVLARHSVVSVVVYDSSGVQARDAAVFLQPTGSLSKVQIRAQPSADGSFVVPNVPRGDHDLIGVVERTGMSGEFAVLRFTVDGDPAVSHTLHTNRASQLSGVLEIDREADRWPAARLSVTAMSPNLGTPTVLGADGKGIVQPNGHFTMTVLPGARLVQVEGLPPGWAVTSVTLGGRPMTDRLFEFVAGHDVLNARITVSSRLASVTGHLKAESPGNFSGVSVVLFSRDPSQWVRNGRSVIVVPVERDGSFRVPGLRPGDYWAAAIRALEPARLEQREFLVELSRTSTSVRLERPGTTQINLRLSEFR